MSKVVVRKNLNRWFKEKWVDVSRTGKDGKHPPCGRKKAKTSSKGYPKCRPSVKVSSKTPKTSGSMTSGQKRAATKRKRAKKQGVGGKPTIVKQDYPFVAMAEDERQLPIPMHTNQPRLTHPGFSRTDVFQVPTGVGIPLAAAAPRLTRNVGGHQVTHPDDIGEARHKVPHVMTQGVHQGPNVYRMPTFFGLPLYQEYDPDNPNSLFTTGEPMDLAFRLLKYGGRRPPIGVHTQIGRLRQIKEGRHRGLEEKPIPLVGVHRAGYTQEYTPEQAATLPVDQQQKLQMQQPSREVQYMRMKRFPNEQPQGNEVDAGAGFTNYATVYPPSPMLPTGSTELPQVNSNQAEDFLM